LSAEARKRLLDLAVGLPLTLVCAPIIALFCVLIMATSGWPPMIIQTRVGAGERPIRVLKLRTMKLGVPVVAKSLLDRSQAVYAPMGTALRRLSIDEVPQLLNVVAGDMSLVGPRPALPSQTDLLDLRRKHGVIPLKPGITGLAQVLGREELSLSTKVRSEALYARRMSVRLDLMILAWTIRAVLLGRGAF
jgi:O-antigen biosynthesis protein WbqP